uniref:Secreted protein n=1 Tax=Panagrolaimus superbus TaxID=310955 RepID=A0A914YN40_9BILA
MFKVILMLLFFNSSLLLCSGYCRSSLITTWITEGIVKRETTNTATVATGGFCIYMAVTYQGAIVRYYLFF